MTADGKVSGFGRGNDFFLRQEINEELAGKQASDGDLTALAALSGTGLSRRTAANTWELITSEEGTFTPIYTTDGTDFDDVTYDKQFGDYLRVGSFVYFGVQIRTDAITVGSASGGVLVGGLPYTESASAAQHPATVGYSNGFGGDMPGGGLVLPSTAAVTLYYKTSANGGSTALQPSDMATGVNSNSLNISGWYPV